MHSWYFPIYSRFFKQIGFSVEDFKLLENCAVLRIHNSCSKDANGRMVLVATVLQ